MAERALVLLASVVILGVTAQWLAWWLRLPAILLLLIAGFIAGPVTGFLHPDELFGELLFPFVSLAVALILFEGGLNLQLSELQRHGAVVRNLVLGGALVTWILSAGAAYLLIGLDVGVAILLGAVLVVTGPTVIMPLLRHVRPTSRVHSILKWEGILIDPIGATLAMLVFEALVARGVGQAATGAVMGFLKTIVVGGGMGIVGAALLVLALYRHWVPDFLQNPVSLMMVLAVFTIADRLQAESGLLAVTVMGVALANQRRVAVKHIAEFKESLQVVLITALFIVLAARLEPKMVMAMLDGGPLVFVGLLIVLVRPAAVALATWRSELSWRERTLLAWMAPRGIVAAAVSSVFALRLGGSGYPHAEYLSGLTFLVIISTVVLYGLTAAPLARWLGVAQGQPTGALIVGAHSWARALARALQRQGLTVLLVDTDPEKIEAAHAEGLVAYQGNIISEEIKEELDLDGIGCLLAMTYNDEVNALAALHFSDVFGRAQVYQLAPRTYSDREIPRYLRGRILFGAGITYTQLSQWFQQGATIHTLACTKELDYAEWQKQYGTSAIPLFVVTATKKLLPFTLNRAPRPQPGDALIAVILPRPSPRSR